MAAALAVHRRRIRDACAQGCGVGAKPLLETEASLLNAINF